MSAESSLTALAVVGPAQRDAEGLAVLLPNGPP